MRELLYYGWRSQSVGRAQNMFKPRFQITPKTAAALMQLEAVRRELAGLVIQPQLLVSLRETAALTSAHFST
jgi:hypothetical protein